MSEIKESKEILSENLKRKGIKNLPWIGENYIQGIFYDSKNKFQIGGKDNPGKKLLIVNERLYTENDTQNKSEIEYTQTTEVIKDHLDFNKKEVSNGLKTIEKFILGKKYQKNESLDLWNHIAYYTFIQEPTHFDSEGLMLFTTKKEYADAQQAFVEVLEELSPDRVIILGRDLYSHIQIGIKAADDLNVEGINLPDNVYLTKKGKLIQFLTIAERASLNPMSEYWNKAIIKFFKSDIKADGLNEYGVKNFRKFSDLEPIKLKGINILVGANNAGKSSFVKGMVLYLNFLGQWFNGYRFLDFSTPESIEMDITNFGDAKSIFAKRNQPLEFSITLGRYHYDAIFNGKPSDTIVPLMQMTISDTFDTLTKYIIKYSSQRISLQAQLSDVIIDDQSLRSFAADEEPAKDKTPINEKVINAIAFPLSTLGKFFSKKINNWENSSFNNSLKSVRNDITNKAITNDTLKNMKDILTKAKDVLGEKNMGYKQLYIMEQLMAQSVSKSRLYNVKVAFSTDTTIQDIMNIFDTIDANHCDMFSKPINNNSQRSYDYVHLLELSQHRIYSVHDTDDVAKTVTSFCRHFNSPKEYANNPISEFLNKWLKAFDLGIGIDWKDMEKESFMFKVIQKDGKESFLNTFGMGSIHLLVLLLKIANFVLDSNINNNKDVYTGSQMTLFLEEPETNLHPKFQSMLADLFLDIYKFSNVQLVVETHSEYLIRKIQVLVGKSNYSSKREMDDCNPFAVYYFDEQKGAYSMNFNTKGIFINEFGSGFYDEATKLTFAILGINNSKGDF